MSGLFDMIQDPSTMDHATLYRMRTLPMDQSAQDQLAGYEHRAFAREAVGENPFMAVPIGLAAPLYQMSKFLPGNMSRSNPSFSQLGQAYTGIGEGIMSLLNRKGLLK